MVRTKIIHYRQLYIDRPDPIVFIRITVDTSDHIYDDFLRLLFLHTHREVSTLANNIPEKSSHSRFLRAACLTNNNSRRVSDEFFDESFCEFFIPTEDCPTTTKLTGLGNTRKLFKMESFRGPQRAWFHFVHSTVKFENRKKGDRSSDFIINKTRISVQLQLRLNSLRKGVDHGSTVSCASQDIIFHIPVRLDIWRWRTTRINVRLIHSTERQRIRTVTKFVGSSPGHSGSEFCSSVMKLADLILVQTSHSPLTIDTETLGLSITGEKYTVVSSQHMVTCSCSPSLPLCSVVRYFKVCVLFFLKKQVRHRNNVKISSNRWELKINKDCENSQSLWF